MWLVLALVVLALIGWAFVALARKANETDEDLAAMHSERDAPIGIWGIFRRRR